jgi:NAD(P)H dehydrogenase (quinone)
MHALLVLAHPNQNSLTHSVAAQIADGLASSNSDQSFEIADLAAEGFDPRFTATDIAVQLGEMPPSADVIAEQARIDRADTLVLVYPVYWWSMPALLKGWIDRVFTNGWAYDEDPNGKIEKKLGHLRVHLVAIGGADERTYARHGYFGAMKMQIDHGIFGYCGAPVVTSELLTGLEAQNVSSHLKTAHRIGRNLYRQAVGCI